MNKARRKELERAIELMEEARDIIEDCKAEEEEYLENMPENLQYSEKHDIAEATVEAMERAVESVEDAISNAEEASE